MNNPVEPVEGWFEFLLGYGILAECPNGLTPPGEWFEGPHPDYDPNKSIIHIDPDTGRFTATSHEWERSHISKPEAWADQNFQPLPSPTGNALFHRGKVTTVEGESIRVGTVPLTGGHAGASDLAEAMAAYDDPAKQRIVGRAIETETGVLICGSILPGTTRAEVEMMHRSALSGDWRSLPELGGLFDYVGPCVVTVPGLPVGVPGLAGEEPAETQDARSVIERFEDIIGGESWDTTMEISNGELVMATGTNTKRPQPVTASLSDDGLNQAIERLVRERDTRAAVAAAGVQAMAGDEDLEPRLVSIEEELAKLSMAVNKILADREETDPDNLEPADAEADDSEG